MSFIPNPQKLYIPRKNTRPKGKDLNQNDADINWRAIENWANSLQTGGGVTAGQFRTAAGPGGIGGTNQWVPLAGGDLGESWTWLIETTADTGTFPDTGFGTGWMIHATAGTAVLSLPDLFAPTFSGASSITLQDFHIAAMDAAYTNAHRWRYTGSSAITSGASISTTAAQFTTENPVAGSDLTLGSSGIVTTAGGVFWAGYYGRLDYTGAVFNV